MMCPMPKGFEAPKFIYEKRKKYVFRSGAALLNTTSLLKPLNLFMGIPSALPPLAASPDDPEST